MEGVAERRNTELSFKVQEVAERSGKKKEGAWTKPFEQRNRFENTKFI